MNSTWMSRLVARWKGRTSAPKEGVGGEENASAGERTTGERTTQDHARARRIGFSRFYGQRVVDAVRRLYGRRRERTPLQRSLFLGTAALVAVAAYLGFAGVPFGPTPIGVETPEQGLTTKLVEVAPEEFFVLDEDFFVADAPGTTDDRAESVEFAESAESAEPTAATQSGASLVARGPGSEAVIPDQERSVPQPTEVRPTPDTPSTPQGSQSSSTPRPQSSLPAVSITSMVLPVAGETIQSYGWYRHPVFGDWRHTSSVVIKPTEDGNVRAALSGRVRDVVYEGGTWRISIEHAGGWSTEYEGLLEVAVGSYQLVETNQVIGHIDPHVGWGVGFAVRQGDVAVNPMSLIDGGSLPASTN